MHVAAPEQAANTRLRSLRQVLAAGSAALGLQLPETRLSQLLAYLELLDKWNGAYNLTAVRKVDDMVARHLLDSLAVAPHLRGHRCIDVGTGAGLPGVPLAICFPERHFTLLDANGKKTRFLFEVKTRLQLSNLTIHQQRVENFRTETPYDAVLSRAFAALADMAAACAHLLAPAGRYLAMKGQYPTEELAVLKGSGVEPEVLPLRVPGLDEPRHLIIFGGPRAAGDRGDA